MTRQASVAWLCLGAAIVAGVRLAGERQELSKAEADRMGQKLAAIVNAAETRPADAPPLETVITEREANAYFRHYGQEFLPTGVINPTIAINEGGRVSALAVVNLDLVRTSQQRGWLDPLAYVSGLLEVRAAGTVVGANRRGVFRYESATLGGVPVPKSVLQELVRHYTTSPDLPGGFDLDQPFELPSGIKSVTSTRGSARITQ